MLRVTVPYHNRDLKRGTLQSIVKQAGFTNEEFLKLLETAALAVSRSLPTAHCSPLTALVHCFGA